MTNKVFILVALPGAGKTTFCKAEFPDALRCSSDDYFEKIVDGSVVYDFKPELLGEAHRACLRKFVKGIEEKVPLIVVDNTNLSIAEIAPYAALAQAYEYQLEILLIDVNPEVAFARNKHGVPRDIFEKMMTAFFTLKIPSWWPNRTIYFETKR